MRRIPKLLAVVTLIAATVSVASPAASVGAVIYVDIAAAGADDGSSWGDAFTDLRDALAVAEEGVEIRVAEGTYQGSFDLSIDNVRLVGGYATGGVAGPDPDRYRTILRGDVLVGEDGPRARGVVLEGVTITEGSVEIWENSEATIVDSAVVAGSGITVIDGELMLIDSVVAHNTKTNGGGIWAITYPQITVIDSVVAYNTATSTGGGIYQSDGYLDIRGSQIVHNSAAGDGGGIEVQSLVDPGGMRAVVDSVISNNEAGGDGGGIHAEDAWLDIVDSVVSDNVAGGDGGGVEISRNSGLGFINYLVTANHANGQGAGIFVEDTHNTDRASLVNTVVAHNTSSGPGAQVDVVDADLVVANSIVWSSGTTGITGDVLSTVTVDHSDVVGWTGGGVGNIDVDREFVGPGNYRLQPTSPAREAGDNTAVPPDTFDVDGDGNTTEPTPDLDRRDRIAGIVDMGAYEMPLATITPGGFVANPEGDSGSTIYQIPVTLSQAEEVPVSIDWNTVDVLPNPQVAQAGSDFVSASGTLTFLPGETVQTVDIEILGDTVDEPPLLYGEWGLVQFTNPRFATLDTRAFFGLGLFIIIDDDP